MLKEQNMKMAKELARELVVVQRRKNEQSIADAFNELKKVVTDVWNTIKNTITNLVDSLHETERKKKHDYNWRVPSDTTKPSQIKNFAPRLPYIRSGI